MTLEYNEYLINSFNGAVASLTDEVPYAEFSYNLTKAEEDILSLVHINSSVYAPDYIATSSEANLESDLLNLLLKVGNKEELSKEVIKIISKVVNPILQSSSDAKSVYIGCNEAKDEDPIFWHIDKGTDNYRVSLVFKGDSTLYCKPPKTCDKDEACSSDLDEKNAINGSLPLTCAEDDVYSAAPYKGTVFLVNKAIHSAPVRDNERLVLFISFTNTKIY